MPLHRTVLRDGLGWGFALWAFGYVLGFVFYPFVPVEVLGWVITPIGLLVTGFVLWKYVRVSDLGLAIRIGILWCGIAIILDYAFIVLLLSPADGYYKADVFFYYLSALILPVLAAVLRRRHSGAA